MLLTIVLILYVLVLLLDFLPGYKRQPLRVNVFYGAAMAVSLCVLILYSLNINVPGPTEPIRKAVEWVLSLGSH